MSLLEFNNVSYSYQSGVEVLKNISFNVFKNDFFALLGKNGSGKTTLLKHFNGLIKPGSGEIFLNGKNISLSSEKEIFQKIGFVFQNPDDQLFLPTVGDDAAYGPKNLGLTSSETKDRVLKSLEQTGITHLAARPIHELSYGEKKRCAIAGVLAMNPEILLIDEPGSFLDPIGADSILRLLKKLNTKEGKTIIIASHNIDAIPIFVNNLAVLHKGCIAVKGTPEEVFKSVDKLRSAGLRLPRMAHLAEILHSKDQLDIESMPLTISQVRKQVLKLVKSH